MRLDTPDLFAIFLAVYDNHHDHQIYTLEGDAYAVYRATHDRLVHERLRSTNEDVQGILSKARGYCARIAMVIHTLEQALQSINQPDTPSSWTTDVSVKAVQAASTITDHFNQQKFILLGLTDDDSNSLHSSSMSSRISKLLCANFKANDGTITPSEVSQKHISEKVGQSNPTAKAVELLKEAESMGFGSLEDITPANKRKTVVFRKRSYCHLTEECQEILKRARIAETSYSLTFNDTQEE